MKAPYETKQHEDSCVVQWKNMKADNEGSLLNCALLDVLNVTFEGNFGYDAEIIMEGMVGDKFFPLTTPHGGIVSSRSESLENILGRYLFVRPRVINGTEETNITVYLFCDTIKKRRLGR